MEFMTEYPCQDGDGADRYLHARRITHVQGDTRRFYIVAEGKRTGDRATISFSHEEFEAVIADYQEHRPIYFRNGFSVHGPARLIRGINFIFKRFPHLAAGVAIEHQPGTTTTEVTQP